MMIQRFSLLCLVAVLVLGCYGLKGPEKPENLISKDNMVNILIDIRLVSAATGANKRTLESKVANKEAYIFNKYNIDSLQFALSNEYYAYHVDDYDDIYTRVKDSLEKLKTFYKDLETKELEEKKKQDSLQALIKKDSLKLNRKLDSIRRVMKKDTLGLRQILDSVRAAHKAIRPILKKDSLTEIKLQEQLIPPVSDNVVQD
ncbi:DUF4296 domain-containing protein [Aestuariivivens insulae]|uniref:DUF4296 domain-containing protein n=1 Tax=Aestuariivivens insulae TaxID=1621988 RepID=UPI001F57981A|nr:DUF4296 domain-containing protein [Aestuariivivens insulae]